MPLPPSKIDRADADFQAHKWDDAIFLYKQALVDGLPLGGPGIRGSMAYVRRRISLAHLYWGIAKRDSFDYAGGAEEFRLSLAADPSNKEARWRLGAYEKEAHADGGQFMWVGDRQVASASDSSQPDVQLDTSSGTGTVSDADVDTAIVAVQDAFSRWSMDIRAGVSSTDSRRADAASAMHELEALKSSASAAGRRKIVATLKKYSGSIAMMSDPSYAATLR
ncbi:MAG TPA: hypothetical protein VGK19_18165 [Capsulimonadaceae bacterium]|jgi:hypothetical protein